MPARISRAAYADMFGPTTGDKVRLADTELFIEVENDFTTYGEEVKFGGGKVIRDGMGQSQTTRHDGAVDTVITNALILDHWGIVKADIGLKGQVVTDDDGNKVEGFQVHLGGGLGLDAGYGRKLRGHKVLSSELTEYVTRVVQHYVDHREEGETFRQWVVRADEADLR